MHTLQALCSKDMIERKHYVYFTPIQTRWNDNDNYGHVNNALFYQYYDTVVNCFLVEQGGLNIATSKTVAYVVSSTCTYHFPVSFPAVLDAGMRINRIGKSSVEYGVAVFLNGEPSAATHGTFTHVFVDRATGKSTPIPHDALSAIEQLQSKAAD